VRARAQAARSVTLQGHYAGSVSRLLAYAVDLAASSGLFAVALAAISFVVKVVSGRQVTWNRESLALTIIFVAWQFFYFGYSWAASGKTFGMAVLGLRVMRSGGEILDARHGVLRALVFPLSFLLLGLGFLGILVQRERRALHDLIAGTAVVYAWDARAARLRFLARQAEPVPGGRPGRSGSSDSHPLPAGPGQHGPNGNHVERDDHELPERVAAQEQEPRATACPAAFRAFW